MRKYKKNSNKNELKMINVKQKQAVRMIFNEDRLCHSRPLLKTLKRRKGNSVLLTFSKNCKLKID